MSCQSSVVSHQWRKTQPRGLEVPDPFCQLHKNLINQVFLRDMEARKWADKQKGEKFQ